MKLSSALYERKKSHWQWPLLTLMMMCVCLLTPLGCEDTRIDGGDSDNLEGFTSASEQKAVHELVGHIAALSRLPDTIDAALQVTSSKQPLLTLLAPETASSLMGSPALSSVNTAALAALKLKARDRLGDAGGGDCLLTTSSTVTIRECEVDGHIIDGTWWSEGESQNQRTHMELVDVFLLGPGDHGSLWIEASVETRSTVRSLAEHGLDGVSWQGNSEIGIMWTTADRAHTLDVSLHVDDLVIDSEAAASPCVNAGALTIRGSLDGEDVDDVILSFGPGCDDVAVIRQ